MSDAELLAAEKKVAAYFALEPSNPTNQELHRLQQSEHRLAAKYGALAQEVSDRLNELEKTPWYSRLLANARYSAQLSELEKLSARRHNAYDDWNATKTKTVECRRQQEEYQRWQESPQTQEMEKLREYLNTQQAQTRLKEIKAQQLRELARKLERQRHTQQHQHQPKSLTPQQMWQRYGRQSGQMDKAAQLALREGQAHEKILEMLSFSPQYQSCLDQYGPKNAQQLAELALIAAIRKSAQEQGQQLTQPPAQQKPEQERSRGFSL